MIIGIYGPKGCGKTTAAKRIMQLDERFTALSFASPLKRMLSVGLGLTDAQLHGAAKEVIDERYGCTPRHIMQTLGTEWGRNCIKPDLWVSLAARRLRPFTVVDDVRFEDEAACIRELGGVVVHIRGARHNDAHASEAGIERREDVDRLVYNDSSLEQFHASVDIVMQMLGRAT